MYEVESNSLWYMYQSVTNAIVIGSVTYAFSVTKSNKIYNSSELKVWAVTLWEFSQPDELYSHFILRIRYSQNVMSSNAKQI